MMLHAWLLVLCQNMHEQFSIVYALRVAQAILDLEDYGVMV
jgi:hypothetical protein